MSIRARISPAALDDHPLEAGSEVCAVSFVVPAFNAMATLPACIQSIRAAAPADSEVVVVIDGALDDTARLAAELADSVVLRPCQGGAARARNDGARVARGRVLFFVDADVTVNRVAVAGALAHLEDGVAAVFGAYEPLPPLAVRNTATTYKNLLHHYTHLHGTRVAHTFWSGFGAIRREAFRAVRGFDPAVTTGADVEDIHLGYRLRQAGFDIVLDPTLQVQHHKHYNFRGVVTSDIVHRAIPWTRAMLQLRVMSPDLNLRRDAMLASALTYAVPGAAAASALVGARGLVSAAVLFAGWTSLNGRFLGYVRQHTDLRTTAASAGMLYLYGLYCPPGVVLGATAHLLRRGCTSRLNWLRLDPARDEAPEVAVTLAVIAKAAEDLEMLEALPEPASWWELIVVSPVVRQGLPPGCRFLLANSHNSRHQMRQQALEVARGEMFATLDANCVPDPGWLDQVREAAAGAHVVVAGSFHQDRRSVRQRAEQVSRYWQWRPERSAGWVTDHPATNAAFRRDVTRMLGGFREEGALLLRMAGFGARPVHFNPAMGVHLRGRTVVRRFVPGVGGTSRLRAAAASRYFELNPLSRVTLAALTPVSGARALGATVRSAMAEGTADRNFWLALPLTTVALASHWVGRALGLLQPRQRGGLVPRSADDLAYLAEPSPSAPSMPAPSTSSP